MIATLVGIFLICICVILCVLFIVYTTYSIIDVIREGWDWADIAPLMLLVVVEDLFIAFVMAMFFVAIF